MAILAAVFAGLTSILAKCGIRKTDSDVATLFRTFVVLIFAWLMVFVVGSQEQISAIGGKSLLFLVLSGMATGGSWLCYFKALSIGDVNKVVPIDKSSTVLTVLLAIVLFHETHNLAIKLFGTALLGIGILLMVEKKANTNAEHGGRWVIYAFGAAVFAALMPAMPAPTIKISVCIMLPPPAFGRWYSCSGCPDKGPSHCQRGV